VGAVDLLARVALKRPYDVFHLVQAVAVKFFVKSQEILRQLNGRLDYSFRLRAGLGLVFTGWQQRYDDKNEREVFHVSAEIKWQKLSEKAILNNRHRINFISR